MNSEAVDWIAESGYMLRIPVQTVGVLRLLRLDNRKISDLRGFGGHGGWPGSRQTGTQIRLIPNARIGRNNYI